MAEQTAVLCNSIMHSLQCNFTEPPNGVDGASFFLSDLGPGRVTVLCSMKY